MTLEGLGEMFEGYSVETCDGKILLVPIEGQVESPACANLGARTPVNASRIFIITMSNWKRIPISSKRKLERIASY